MPREIYKVNIIEWERGWGQKVDTVLYFSDETVAKEFVELHNASNNLPKTPDIYWFADFPSSFFIPDEGDIITTREEMLKQVPPMATLYATNKGLTTR